MNYNTRKLEWASSQEYTTLRIDVPKDNDKAPLSAEQMFASLHGIYSDKAEFQAQISFEIVSRDKFLQFYVYLPTHLKSYIEGQIYAQYPTVEILEVPDYTNSVDRESVNFAVCELEMTKPDVYPIKLFNDFEVDPISGITSVMTSLAHDEEIWLQFIIRPIGDEWQEKGNRMVQAVRNGKKVGGKGIASMVGKEAINVFASMAKQLISPGADTAKAAPAEVKLSAPVEEALKAVESKILKLGFQTKIRVLAISHDTTSARVKCQNLVATFKQFNTTNLNGFRAGDIRGTHEDWVKFQKRYFIDNGNIFNIGELASVYHFPHLSVSTPNIVWSGAKKGEPPANIPLPESVNENDFTVLGETNFRNAFRKFGIKRDDRRRHVYIVGKSGVGKSVLIENMAKNDIYRGSGVIIVDPHGELAEKVLSCVPDDRIDDVIVFDPSDREFPVAFNLLEHVSDDFKSLVASGFVGIFKKIFGESWGPRLEHILRNTVFALLDYPDCTMLDIPRMLTNSRFRDKVVAEVRDPVIREFWVNEFASFDSKFRTEAVSPILNKVGQFLASSTIRNIVGQYRSRINIREVMDQEKILIINLSRGKIGEDNSALLGAMIITKIQLAAMSRADVTVDQRPDTYLYVDEFQNFATESFAVILAEARKYNLSLTMAHQYIAQMDEKVRDAVFGNAGTMITFRVGGADAEFLAKEYEPVFLANDLVNLDKYHIYIKLLIDGVASPAFSARTLPPIERITGNVEKVVARSREIYANPRLEVEEMINNRSKQEELELHAEAVAFKSGGLEALLTKNYPKPVVEPTKPASVATSNTSLVVEEPILPAAVAPTQVQAEAVNAVATVPTQGQAEGEVRETKDNKKVFKYQNIIEDKIYKERTARNNIKWYIGEKIDLDKMAEQGIEVSEEAKNMIDLAKKVAVPRDNSKSNNSGGRDHSQVNHRHDYSKPAVNEAATEHKAQAESHEVMAPVLESGVPLQSDMSHNVNIEPVNNVQKEPVIEPVQSQVINSSQNIAQPTVVEAGSSNQSDHQVLEAGTSTKIEE